MEGLFMKNEEFIKLLPFETNNLIIRKTILSDTYLLIKMDKNEEVQKFLGGIKNATFSERKKFMQKKIYKFDQGIIGMLTVVLKASSEPIGFLNFDINESCNNAELSYIFDFDYWNKGYCTEAAKKLVEVAFKNLKLHRVYSYTIAGNIGSVKVLEKIGMIKEGERREHVFVNEISEYRNFIDYGILCCEYKD
jgi:RimJ/RimL family protein N-acetyltransferase